MESTARLNGEIYTDSLVAYKYDIYTLYGTKIL